MFRPQWRSVKKFVRFFVKKKKLFERSEFFFFRKKVQILASEVQPANFFCFVFFVRAKKMKSPCGLSLNKSISPRTTLPDCSA